jgi:hypothetical protein
MLRLLLMEASMTVTYFHPVEHEGRRLSTANIIWAERNLGDEYYRYSKFAMKGGRFPANHPCAPFELHTSDNAGQLGTTPALTAFRARGYWASCFPEGDGITLKWWNDQRAVDKTEERVMQDIRECFGWALKKPVEPV